MNKIALCLLVLSPVGCAPSVAPVGTGPGTGPGSGGCTETNSCAPSPTSGPSCGAQTFSIGSSKVAPDIYFIVDASGSMAADPFGDPDPTKWNGLQMALANVLSSHTGQARYGLSMFPAESFDGCQPGQVDVPIAAGTEAQITARINSISANDVYDFGGGTPTAATMHAAATVAGLKDSTRPNYVVLMTDGEPACAGNESVPSVVSAITALQAASPSVKTFVIGFGDVNNSDPTALNAFATAGGTARTGSVQYYPAQNATDLEHAFDQIVSGVASCDYKLAMPPTDPSLVAPAFDNTPVPQNATNGFSYDAPTQTVTFHGATCDQLKSGAVHDVQFVYGCAPQTVL